MHTCITAGAAICLGANVAFETPPSTGKHCGLSAVINAKSLQNRGNTSQKLWRERLGGEKKNTKPIVAVNEDIAKFHRFSHLSPIIPDASSRKNYETFPS